MEIPSDGLRSVGQPICCLALTLEAALMIGCVVHCTPKPSRSCQLACARNYPIPGRQAHCGPRILMLGVSILPLNSETEAGLDMPWFYIASWLLGSSAQLGEAEERSPHASILQLSFSRSLTKPRSTTELSNITTEASYIARYMACNSMFHAAEQCWTLRPR